MGLHYQLPIWVDTSRLLAITDMLTDRQTDKTDRQNSNMTWIAIGLGEVRRKDERFTPAVPLWSRQWTSRCRRPRKLLYIDFLLIFPGMTFRVHLGGGKCFLHWRRSRSFTLFLFLIYTSLSTLFGPSRPPFLTTRRYTVWEWHKRSLRVNSRLQRESAINTIQYISDALQLCCSTE